MPPITTIARIMAQHTSSHIAMARRFEGDARCTGNPSSGGRGEDSPSSKAGKPPRQSVPAALFHDGIPCTSPDDRIRDAVPSLGLLAPISQLSSAGQAGG